MFPAVTEGFLEEVVRQPARKERLRSAEGRGEDSSGRGNYVEFGGGDI